MRTRHPSTSRAAWRRVERSSDRLLTGTAGGYAEWWGVEPTVLRAALGLLSLVGGLGLVVYACGVATTVPAPAAAAVSHAMKGRGDRRREVAIGAATLSMLVLARTSGVWPGDGVMVPATAVAGAVALLWTRERAQHCGPGAVVRPAARIGAGVVLAGAGIVALADRTGGMAAVGRSASAIGVSVAGVVVVVAPAISRLLSRLDVERVAHAREEERASLAAHLHDSVLQSLVLMQRQDDPRRMLGIARRQERELRSWLYGGHSLGEPSSLSAAVQALMASIEVDHDTRVDAVTVGDRPLDDASAALLGALREAVVNAARHAHVDQVDVFVEVDDDDHTVVAYVRDAGVGFDIGRIAHDRRGVTESIIGRAQRAGGHALVMSEPGTGTEVEIRIPLSSMDEGR